MEPAMGSTSLLHQLALHARAGLSLPQDLGAIPIKLGAGPVAVRCYDCLTYWPNQKIKS